MAIYLAPAWGEAALIPRPLPLTRLFSSPSQPIQLTLGLSIPAIAPAPAQVPTILAGTRGVLQLLNHLSNIA